jgi:hypothetical protein
LRKEQVRYALGKNARSAGNATLHAIEHIHRNDMLVVEGLIVGNPGDTRASIEANLEFVRRHVEDLSLDRRRKLTLYCREHV